MYMCCIFLCLYLVYVCRGIYAYLSMYVYLKDMYVCMYVCGDIQVRKRIITNENICYHVVHARGLCVGHLDVGGDILECIREDEVLDGELSVDEAAAGQLKIPSI